MILEKEFKKNFKGYNVEEVDSFLDEIIQDYETFEKVMAQLREENRQLKKKLKIHRRDNPLLQRQQQVQLILTF